MSSATRGFKVVEGTQCLPSEVPSHTKVGWRRNFHGSPTDLDPLERFGSIIICAVANTPSPKYRTTAIYVAGEVKRIFLQSMSLTQLSGALRQSLLKHGAREPKFQGSALDIATRRVEKQTLQRIQDLRRRFIYWISFIVLVYIPTNISKEIFALASIDILPQQESVKSAIAKWTPRNPTGHRPKRLMSI
jgi:hypothetical protein